MAPSSSAVQLADLALVWSGSSCDLAMIDGDLASDRGLDTAVLLSVFADRRAGVDDVPPSGDPRDRRGWWADEFAADEGDLIGSRLWLLDRGKRTAGTARLAESYVREALAWMLEDGVVSSLEVTTEIASDALLIAIAYQRPGRTDRTVRFSLAWDEPI